MAEIKYKELFEGMNNAIKQTEENIKSLNSTYTDLASTFNTQIKNIDTSKKLTGEEVEKITELSTATEKLKNNKEKLTAQEIEVNKIKKQYATTQAKHAQLLKDENTALQKSKIALTERNKEIRKQIKEEKSASDSIVRMRNELSRLNDIYDRGSEATRNKYRPQIQKLDADIKKLEKSTGRHQRDVANYPQKISGAINSFNVWAASIAATVLGLIKLGKESIEVRRQIDIVSKQFDVSADSARLLTSELRAMTSVYGVEFKDSLKATTALMNEFGMTGEESLSIINDGFAKGADVNGEYLETVKEYSTQFKAAGLSAKQMVAFISQTENKGIFSDKAPDTIKEGTLRLREMTTATRAALDGIGIDSKSLIERLKTNQITYFEAIQEVSAKLNTLGDQSPKVGTAIADIFGGAGEDVGIGFLKTLKDINLELSDIENVNEAAKGYENMLTSWSKFIDKITSNGSVIDDFFNIVGDAFASTSDIMNSFYTDLADSSEKLKKSAIELAEITGVTLYSQLQENRNIKKKEVELLKEQIKEQETLRSQGKRWYPEIIKENRDLIAVYDIEIERIKALAKEESKRERQSSASKLNESKELARQKSLGGDKELSKTSPKIEGINAETEAYNKLSIASQEAAGNMKDIEQINFSDVFRTDVMDSWSSKILEKEDEIHMMQRGLSDLSGIIQEQANMQRDVISQYDNDLVSLREKMQEEATKRANGEDNSYAQTRANYQKTKKLREKEAAEYKKKARELLIIQKTQQASELLLAAAKLYNTSATLGPIGIAGAALSIGVMLYQFANFKSDVRKLRKGGLLKGESHENGGVPILINGQHRYEAEGGEYVTNTRATKNSINAIEAINSHKLTDKDIFPALELYDRYNKQELSGRNTNTINVIGDNKDIITAVNNQTKVLSKSDSKYNEGNSVVMKTGNTVHKKTYI